MRSDNKIILQGRWYPAVFNLKAQYTCRSRNDEKNGDNLQSVHCG